MNRQQLQWFFAMFLFLTAKNNNGPCIKYCKLDTVVIKQRLVCSVLAGLRFWLICKSIKLIRNASIDSTGIINVYCFHLHIYYLKYWKQKSCNRRTTFVSFKNWFIFEGHWDREHEEPLHKVKVLYKWIWLKLYIQAKKPTGTFLRVYLEATYYKAKPDLCLSSGVSFDPRHDLV